MIILGGRYFYYSVWYTQRNCESGWFKPNLDCNYTFPNNLPSKGTSVLSVQCHHSPAFVCINQMQDRENSYHVDDTCRVIKTACGTHNDLPSVIALFISFFDIYLCFLMQIIEICFKQYIHVHNFCRFTGLCLEFSKVKF